MGEAKRVVQFPAAGALDQGWDTVLLPEGLEIVGQCVRIEILESFRYHRKSEAQRKKVLIFKVQEPIRYSYFDGELDTPEKDKRPVLLKKYVREEKWWKAPPLRSTLRRLLLIAQDGRPDPRIKRLSRELFLNKLFRCSTKNVKADGSGVEYTTIDEVLEKVVG